MKEILISIIDQFQAVSYTHLDVYKRQGAGAQAKWEKIHRTGLDRLPLGFSM